MVFVAGLPFLADLLTDDKLLPSFSSSLFIFENSSDDIELFKFSILSKSFSLSSLLFDIWDQDLLDGNLVLKVLTQIDYFENPRLLGGIPFRKRANLSLISLETKLLLELKFRLLISGSWTLAAFPLFPNIFAFEILLCFSSSLLLHFYN